jgi:hypothetical protein
MNTFHVSEPPTLQPAFLRRAAVALLLSVALAGGPPAFCGPIHDAAREGDVAKVKSLLKLHPDLVSSEDEKYGQTPLHIAAFNDRKEVVELLLADKADVNAKANNGSTPLHLAAAKGNKDIVELLLEHNADVNALDKDGWSPLHSAVNWGHADLDELFTKHGGQDIPAPKKPAPAASAENSAPKEIKRDGRFIAYNNETVLDTKTNLMWASRDNNSAVGYPNAQHFPTTYKGGGYSDWRLPTLAELSGLYDKDKTRKSYCAAAVDELGTPADEVHLTELISLSGTRVWTSEERNDKPGWVALYDFHSGKDVSRPDTKEFADAASRVLVVRDNKDNKAGAESKDSKAGAESKDEKK